MEVWYLDWVSNAIEIPSYLEVRLLEGNGGW